MGETALTIEFLRARLLSERSVSRSAKKRADELANRVMELEEQLMLVSLQRKKAEKATSDVLAILETHGFSDNSEGYDSSSDQGLIHPQSTNGSCSTMNIDKSRSIDHQGLELPKFFSRSLSWKSSKYAPHAYEKKLLIASSRRRNSLMSTDSSSPKHHLGKSCRQNKRSETRSTANDLNNNDALLVSQISDNDSNLSRYSENPAERLLTGDPWSVSVRSPRKLINLEHYSHIIEGTREMERALEHQEDLICRYEDEESVQNEWEEKYIETNSSALVCFTSPSGLKSRRSIRIQESFEPGNQSDVTEERDELKKQPPGFCPVNENSNSELKEENVATQVCRVLTNDVHLFPQIREGPEKYQTMNNPSQPPHPDIDIPLNKRKQIQEPQEGSSHLPPLPAMQQSPVSNYMSSSQEISIEKYHKGEVCRTPPRKSISVPGESSKELASVLEALQRAKLSLQQKLKPLSEGTYIGKAKEPEHVPSTSSSAARAENSVAHASSFRASAVLQDGLNNMDSRSQSSLTHFYHNSSSAVPEYDQFKLNPRAEVTRPNVSVGSSFDFNVNRATPQSSLYRENQYAQSPVHSDRSFTSQDLFKFNSLPETLTSAHFNSDQRIPMPYKDPHFSLLTSHRYRSSSLLEDEISSFIEVDQHVPGARVNRVSISTNDRQESNSRGEAARSSLIDNGPYNINPYNGSSLIMPSHSQILSNTNSGPPQPLAPVTYYSHNTDVSLFPHARYSYQPSHSLVPEFNQPLSPMLPSFSCFPSSPPPPGLTHNHETDMYRV